MKMSARNRFSGTVMEVKKGQVMAQVTVDIGGGDKVNRRSSSRAPRISASRPATRSAR